MGRYKSVVCCDLVITKNENLILLMKRQNTGTNDGEYELPGGHLEEGEDIFNCMIREAKEELCISLKRNDLTLVHIMHHYKEGRINFIFQTTLKDKEPKIGESNKCSELCWVDINHLPKETTKKVRKIIKNIQNKEYYDSM